MRTIGFIGAYDKIDLTLCIARVLVELNKKVIIIDSTTLQKARYVVPNISPSDRYITSFEGIDVAVGFENYNEIKEYLGTPLNTELDYDYIIVDVDNPEGIKNFNIKTAMQNYFVTGVDVYSMKKGLEALNGVEEPMLLSKVIFSKDLTKEEEEYLNYLALGYKVIWDEEKVYFPFEQGDQTVLAENQRVAKIKFRKLTQFYKDSLMYLTVRIAGDNKEVQRAFKQIDKGV